MKSKKRKSKKHSNTKESYVKRLKDHTFFVDRSSGRTQLAEGLKALGLSVETHDDHFSATTPDIEWLSYCGEKQWIIISSDLNIKKNLIEQKALLSAKVASFFFTSGTFTTKQQLNAFEKALRKITNYVLTVERPFIARIYKGGQFELWVNSKGEDCVKKKQERLRIKRLTKTKNK